MATLSAQSIINRLVFDPRPDHDGERRPMVDPFEPRTKAFGRSFGLSSCGYDIRLAETRWVWPLWGRLGYSVEHIVLPNNLWAEVKDKSTNARLFVLVQNTVIEPGWHGYLTIELTRFKPWPIRLRAGTPIAQIMFHELDQSTVMPYDGKYLGQGPKASAAILK